MGSATQSNAQPQMMAQKNSKTLKNFFKAIFKKDKKREKSEVAEAKPATEATHSISEEAIENVLQNIEKLKIETTVEKEGKLEKEENEFENFTYKTVKDEGRNDRSDSHSSEDSGFAEKLDEEVASDVESDKKDEVIVAFGKLDIQDKDDQDKCPKEKRKQTVVVSRGPVRPKGGDFKIAPYYVEQKDHCRQIQINKQTLTGGQVIVNRSIDLQEVDAALRHVQQTSRDSQHEDQDEWLNIIAEVIQGDSAQCKPQDTITDRRKDAMDSSVEDLLSDFFQTQQLQQDYYQPPEEPPQPETMTPPHQDQSDMSYYQEDPITEFPNQDCFLEKLDFQTLNNFVTIPPYKSPNSQFIFPTPPHSENAASPMSDTQGSYRTSESLYSPCRSVILSSPERSSPICNSDYEKFQEIPHYEESSVSLDEEKKRERNNSSSSMTMKQYKDLQKEIAQSFSKKECCQLTRKTWKELFQEHLQRLSIEDRSNICLKVAKMDLKHAYRELTAVLKSLSQSSDQEDLYHAYFCLVCERVLAQMPAWYVDDFGLNLLKAATLRCFSRPLLTRYLVQCVRTAISLDPSSVQGKESVFHEVDAQGDTLLTACARRGDACAGALAELVRREPDQLPLFRVHHLNCDGASALHVACLEHSAREPRLLIVHVLLEHAGADLWQGDAKAGDTPVHMAVNSKSCDLRLIMVLFRHVDRKTWKKLAHAPNLCSTTPLEYARSATKSPVRDGYPVEVLEFLKKCR